MNLKERIRNLPLPVREWGVFSGWIAGLLLICVLAWACTGGVRSRFLARQVNRFLERQQSVWRLVTPLSARGAGSSRFGAWFVLANTDSGAEKKGVLFMLQSGVQSLTFLAVVDDGGRVETMLPASVNARSQFPLIPEGMLRLYVRRIEESFGRVILERRND